MWKAYLLSLSYNFTPVLYFLFISNQFTYFILFFTWVGSRGTLVVQFEPVLISHLLFVEKLSGYTTLLFVHQPYVGL